MIVKKLFIALMCACVLVSACDNKNLNIDEPDGPSIVNPDDIVVDKDEVLDDHAQKEKLEQVAVKLMQQFDAKEYEDLIELSEVMFSHCERYFEDDDYDWSNVEDALEEIGETLYDEKQSGQNKWEYTYTLFLSNCTGILTLDKYKATYKDSKDTKVIIKDVDGEDWEFEVTPKGLKKVYLGEYIETYYDYYYDEAYEDVYNVTVEIPSSLALKVKRDGKFFADAEVRFDYSISKDGVDVEKDRVSVEVDLKIDDLVMTLKNAACNASTGKVEYSIALKKGSVFIFSQSVSVSADINIEGDDDEIFIEDWDGSADVEINILGEIQIKGSCRDLNKLYFYLDETYYSERECERAAGNVTALVDLAVYYDGTSVKQARIEFEPVADETFYGEEYYWIEPVIVFDDGTRYFFYEYFDDRIFEDLVEDFEDFIYDYEDMVDEIY